MDDERARQDVGGQTWVHHRNIERYKVLLANPAKQDSHEQVRKLLAEEREKLRSFEKG